MTTLLQVLSVIIVTIVLGCGSQSGDITNINKASALVNTPRIPVRNYGVDDTTRLFAFVGEKISVDPLPHEQGSMDYGFKAKYLIVKNVYGDFPQDTIEFVARDHYGTPAFSKFKNVLLFVSADSGFYYHQKYMYNDVYKTKDGRWAGTYASDDYEHAFNRHTKIKPVKIEFAEKVSFPIKTTDEEGRQLEFSYPKPYFKTIGDSAFAVYGNYVEDLVTLKKEGTLTARGLFEPSAQQGEDMVEASQPEARKTPPTADDLKFLAFWKGFISSLREPELKNFRLIALDSLMICDKLLATDNFINKCFNEVIDDEVQKRIGDKTKLAYTSDEVEFKNLLSFAARKEILKTGKNYRFRQMLVSRNTKNNNPPEVVFNFIETKKGYRLYGIDHHWFKECCR